MRNEWSARLVLLAGIILLAVSVANGQNNTREDSLRAELEKPLDDTTRVNTLNQIARMQNDSTKLWAVIDPSLELSRKVKFRKGEADANTILGNFYARKQIDWVKSTQYYTEALRIRQELDDKKGMGTCYLQLAIIDMHFKNYSKSIALLRKAISLNEAAGNPSGVKVDNQVIAQVYMERLMWDSALYFFRKAERVDYHTTPSTATSYINMISVFVGMKSYDSALVYIHLTDSVYTLLNNEYGHIWTRMNRGQIYLEQGDPQTAIEFLTPAYEYGKANRTGDILLNVYPSLIDAYGQSRNFEMAYTLQKEWEKLKDSLKDSDKANAILAEQIKFEQDEKDKIAALIDAQEKSEFDAQQKKQQIIIWSVTAILILSLLVAFFIFRGYREKKAANEIISRQKHLVEEKQKEIVDSITYAKRLQEAILPPANLVSSALPQSFVLYMPKDIVAGDFYWMERIGDEVLFAVADCTGHGVPGAMVSVVCSNALNRAVKEFGITDTGKILDKVRELVLETFGKSEKEVQDGMDISLARISLARNTVQWSGANNPLWIFTQTGFTEIKADKQPVGRYHNPFPFTSHTVDFTPGTTIYLLTDGYADQFGGEKGKKFRYKQLQELIAGFQSWEMDDQHTGLQDALIRWKGSLEQVDDVCIVGIRRA